MSDKVMEMIAETLQQQTSLLKEMKESNLHTKAPAAAATYTELHGNGSLWGSHPIERDVISAHIRPSGIAGRLISLPSVTENPIFASLTGYTATNGAEAATPCADAPAGYVKGCNLSAAFGRIVRDTQTIEADKVVLRANRGDFTDLRLRGQVLGGTAGTPFLPGGMNQDQILNVVTKSEMVIAGVNMERKLTETLWQGTPANNNAGGGYKEFPGLDLQIATGQKDWHTGALCPALDSDVKSFAYDNVSGGGRDIVEYLSMLEYYIRFNGEQMGLMPVQWVVAMRPQLWFELSSVWPCSYLSNRCTEGSGAENITVINDNVNVSLRDQMRAGMFIDINGNRYPVWTDMGIFEHTNVNNANLLPGQYASSIYFVPLTITGGFPVTYMEYVDYKALGADISLLNEMHEFWSDDGRFLWAIENNNYCYKLKMKTEQRVILRTPQLAGRIDAVKYSPLQHLREFDPANAYFSDGGVSLRADAVQGYSVWR